MAYPSKEQVIEYINLNAPINSKKTFSTVYSYINRYNYNNSCTYESLNEVLTLFLTKTNKNFYLSYNQIFRLSKYTYLNTSDKFITLPWLKLNIEKSYIPDVIHTSDTRIHTIDFDSVYCLLKKYKDASDFNRNVYFRNYHVLEKLFRNNDVMFNIESTDPNVLEDLQNKIAFIDKFFEETGLNPDDLLNMSNKIYIYFNINKKFYNRNSIYCNFLLYRIYKNYKITIYDLLIYHEFTNSHIYDYLNKYFKKYDKNDLKEEFLKCKNMDNSYNILCLLSLKTLKNNNILTHNNIFQTNNNDADTIDSDDEDFKYLTDEERLEMGLPNKNNINKINLCDASKNNIISKTIIIFEAFYNDNYDEELLEIVSILFQKKYVKTSFFNFLLSKGCNLTDKLFNQYCKIGENELIEIFLENKFKPTDDTFLKINFNSNTKITSLLQLFNKYNFYINDTILPQMYNKLKLQGYTDDMIKSFTIYVNNDDEFTKILPQLQENYKKYYEQKTKINNGCIVEINDYFKSNKLTLDIIIECENIVLRRNLLELYKEQNNISNNNIVSDINTKKKVIKRIIKKKVN